VSIAAPAGARQVHRYVHRDHATFQQQDAIGQGHCFGNIVRWP